MLHAVNDLSPRPTQLRFIPIDAFAHDEEEAWLPETPRRRLSLDMPSPTAQAFRVSLRRLSLQFVSKIPAATRSHGFDVEAAPAREARPRRRHEEKPVATEIVVETPVTTAQSALRTRQNSGKRDSGGRIGLARRLSTGKRYMQGRNMMQGQQQRGTTRRRQR
jgi:hypothetical protein